MLELALLAALAIDPKDLKSLEARKNFWSFRPLARPEASSIDELTKAAAPADRRTLIRRATLDITGLPPTFAEVQAFLADRSPNAYEKLIDRLMATPQYGERWAQRWLDVVRYADTNGFELDAERTHAWRYRDYVIRSFNASKPFDRFLKEQIAGDELYPGDDEALIATGFHRAGPQHLVGGNQDEELNRQEVLIEMNAGVGSVFLGLTVQCARCHNHKFDPILQADYYRLSAIFAGTEGRDVSIASSGDWAAHAIERWEWERRIAPVNAAIAEIEKPYRERLRAEKREALPADLKAALAIPREKRTPEQQTLAKNAQDQSTPSWDEVLAALSPADREKRTALRKKLHDIELDEPPPPPHAYAAVNNGKPHATHILKVGDHKMKLGTVEPGVPTVLALALGGAAGGEVTREASGRRSQLANWLASPSHPLTARVFVNRMWQFRLGEGIVRTPNDFGALGERPTNPKLLDWLASEFVASGWDIKKLDRQILLSGAYRAVRPVKRRIDAEVLRDSILAVTGQLNTKMFGPPVKTPLEPEVYDLIFTEYEADNLWPLPRDPREMQRRTIYLLNKRTVRLPMLANFDHPDAMSSCPQRAESTHALQALSMLNSDFMTRAADTLAAKLGKADPVRDAYRLTLARDPRPVERTMARDFFAKGGTLADFSLALLNRHEFVYVP
ncbi:MAG: DUF1549 and DUF1553 domain-containing protein [Bryobacteraceae bacterium]|nr:DUF1549 and DUF1553 domain-containing protein [Bryobacteraceae bacterium]